MTEQVSEGDQALLRRACQTGDLSALEKVLEEPPGKYNVNEIQLVREYYRYDDEDDSNVELDEDCVLYPPLHLASENGQAMVVQKLLTKYKADPNAKNAFGQAPIHIAAVSGHYDVLQTLLDCGNDVDVDIQDQSGRTALHYASKTVAYLLLENYNADLSIRDFITGDNPLHAATKRGDKSLVRYFVENGNLKPTVKNSDGYAALHLAVEFACKGLGKSLMMGQYLSIVDLLIDTYSVDPNIEDTNGRRPLHIAAELGSDDVIDLLVVNYLADVDAVDHEDLTPEDIASRNEQLSAVGKLRSLRSRHMYRSGSMSSSSKP